MKVLLLISLISFSSFAKEYSWYDDLVSPFTTDAKYITYGGLLSAGAVYLNKDSRTYRKRETIDEAKPFGDLGFIGDILGKGYLNVGYAAIFLAHGYFAENNESMQSGEHMAKASLYSTGLTVLLKSLINERRPGYPDDENSFPSGHSSASFAFASVVTAQHGWYWGGAAYGLASFISLSRINDDFHYLHDVIVGMTIGAAYGWGIHYNYENGRPYLLTPVYLPGGGGLKVSWNF